jgi:Chromate transporter
VPEISDSACLSRNDSTRDLALFFLRRGTTAFGGQAAHVAIMEDELVCRRRWLSREKFLDLLGASNLIPGPSSSELAIHIGYLRAWVDRVARCRNLFHLSGGSLRHGPRMVLRAFRQVPSDRRHLVWGQAGRHCNHPAGSLGAGMNGTKDKIPWTGGSVFGCFRVLGFASASFAPTSG